MKKRTIFLLFIVVPFVGTRIEILAMRRVIGLVVVAPFEGAWIEINEDIVETLEKMSLPSRGCGLK